MTKKKMVTLKMNENTAAAVRQVLFDSQVGYSFGDACPDRIFELREVLTDLDDAINQI